MRTVDLRSEAAVEAGRLAGARALLRDGDRRALNLLESDAPWIAFARRLRLRRVYLLWRVAFEDPSGRVVESRLVPVIVEVFRTPEKSERRRWIRTLLRRTEAGVRARVVEESAPWRESAVQVTDAFNAERLRRERAIAERPGGNRAASQPGLFDRRAERSRQTQTAATAAIEGASAARLQAIAALATITPQAARLLLVFVA